MKNIARTFLLAAAATVSLSAQSLITGPSSSQTPYLTPTSPGWSATSILTVGDAIGGYQMAGIPDGLGAFGNGDGTLTLLANHEIGTVSSSDPTLLGTTRAHGAAGGFVSKWVINTSTWQVISGGDFLTSRANQMMWNGTTWAAPATAYAYLRPCSADLPALGAFYDATSGTGYNGRIFLNGEETGAEGKAFAWIVSGADAGKVYELPHHGKYSYENLLARTNYGPTPGAANLLQTVVVGTDDTTPGEVHVYIGTKTNSGNAVERAGLANGQVYGVKASSSVGYSGAIALENATGINGTFTLAPIFTNATIAAKTGAEFQAASTAAGVTQFARPEDAHWLDHDSLILATTGASGSAMNNVTVTSKIYQLDFNSDATNGILTTGGNIRVVVDSQNLTGRDGATARSFDNLTVGNDGLIYIQEDPGNSAYVAKHWIVDPTLATQALRESNAVQIFESDRSRFTTGATLFQTIDEEHSGIIDITAIVNDGVAGSKWFLVAAQNHAAATGASAATLVEGGQFIALNYKVGSNSGVVGNLLTLGNGGAVLASGAAITHDVALTGTGGVFNTTADTSVTGAIGGTGGLWKNGAGILTLNGANSYTGNTNVEAGKLVVNGALTSTVRILKGGAFGGSANITGGLTNLGTLAPGNSPGTVTIAGNYLEAGTLDIEVWGLAAGTQHDQVIASGTATFQSGSNLTVTKTGGTFDLARTQSVRAVVAGAYSGAFSTLDRSTQASQVFFDNATGRIHGSGLTEAQTFADLTTANNRKAVAAALYADGLTSATVLRANAGGSASAKAFIATGEMGAATLAFLGAPDVDAALDALSPEPYGGSAVMASRNALSLARSLTGIRADSEAWTTHLGYDRQQATVAGVVPALAGRFTVESTSAILARQLGAGPTLSLLVADTEGRTSASGFSSKATGQSYGFGLGGAVGIGWLDFSVVNASLTAGGTRSGLAFSDQKLRATSVCARLTLPRAGAFLPYVGLSGNTAKIDAFSETGTGANLNVQQLKQHYLSAEAGLGYDLKLDDNLALRVNLAYEHALGADDGVIQARFADASAPTTFGVRTTGPGLDLFRAGLGLNWNLGKGQAAAFGYDYLAGTGVSSAHQIKANYTFRF